MNSSASSARPLKYALFAIGAQVIFNEFFDLVAFTPDAGLYDYTAAIAPFSAAFIISVLSFDEWAAQGYLAGLGWTWFAFFISAVVTNGLLIDSYNIFDFGEVFKDFIPPRVILRLISQYFEKVSLINVLISAAIGFWLKSKIET